MYNNTLDTNSLPKYSSYKDSSSFYSFLRIHYRDLVDYIHHGEYKPAASNRRSICLSEEPRLTN